MGPLNFSHKVSVVDDMLESELLDRMKVEALALNEHMRTVDKRARAGRHGFWMELDPKTGRRRGGARIAIEHAIERMLRLDYPDGNYPGGAEWWFQIIAKPDGMLLTRTIKHFNPLRPRPSKRRMPRTEPNLWACLLKQVGSDSTTTRTRRWRLLARSSARSRVQSPT